MDTKNRHRHRHLGTGLKAARNAANLTQSDLSRITGIPVGTIREYEQGRCLPSVPRLATLVDALRVPVAGTADLDRYAAVIDYGRRTPEPAARGTRPIDKLVIITGTGI